MALGLPLLILSDDQLEAVEDLAAVNYSPEKIALYLDVDKKTILAHYYEHLSPFRQAYDKGQLVAQFSVHQKQLELAKSGNITAAQIYLKESEAIKTQNILHGILFGHDSE